MIRSLRLSCSGLRAFHVLMALLLVLPLLVGCSQSPSGPSSTPFPTLAAASVPTLESTPTDNASDIWPPTPPVMDTLWQPPEPKKKVELSPPTEVVASPDALIVYGFANMGISGGLKVTTSGQAVVAGYQDRYSVYTLSKDEFDHLKQQIAAADFFNLQDRYWHEDPPGVIAEITIVTITYTEGGRTKSVVIRGSENTPKPLADLENTLSDLNLRTREQGTASGRPDDLVQFYLEGTGHFVWEYNIDVQGGIYYGSGPATAHLSPEDLKALKAALDAISFIGEDTWYTEPQPLRDTIYMSEHRCIITTYGNRHQWINVYSGADVPEKLQTVLAMLATYYDKYAP